LLTIVDVNIGNAVKGASYTGSISGQIAQLRALFKQATTNESNIGRAIQGDFPVVAHVNQADQIAAMIRLKNEFGFQLIIHGGAEAHLVANLLAKNNVSVIYIRTPPSTFENWDATPATPSILLNAGVTVAIAIYDPALPRNLRWEAGFAVSAGMPYDQGIGLYFERYYIGD
jgi:imidazolonepropionase-like amidohydrolase